MNRFVREKNPTYIKKNIYIKLILEIHTRQKYTYK